LKDQTLSYWWKNLLANDPLGVQPMDECAASAIERCMWSVELSFLSTFWLFNLCCFMLFSCLAYSSALKMEVVCSSEMLTDFTGLHVVKCQKMNFSGYSE
jgi:hypothetical protein